MVGFSTRRCTRRRSGSCPTRRTTRRRISPGLRRAGPLCRSPRTSTTSTSCPTARPPDRVIRDSWISPRYWTQLFDSLKREFETFKREIKQELKEEFRHELQPLKDAVARIDSRLSRQGGIIQGGSRQVARLVSWSEDTDELLAARDRRAGDNRPFVGYGIPEVGMSGQSAPLDGRTGTVRPPIHTVQTASHAGVASGHAASAAGCSPVQIVVRPIAKYTAATRQ